MAKSHPAIAAEIDRDGDDRARRHEYSAAFRKFGASLGPAVRARINGSAVADWPTTRTFALPVTPDNPAYRTDPADPVFETLDEIGALAGALPKIAVWLNDRMPHTPVFDSMLAAEQLRLSIARICEAKNPRLEAFLISLAIGMNLEDNANGYAIAAHFGLSPQRIHEMLGDTCAALGQPKPLAKANKARYSKTQYSHNIRSQK